MQSKHQYVIVGSGLAGVSAAEAIREIDKSGSILVLGREPDLPYDRPPLAKQLWFGKKKPEEIFLQPRAWYETNVQDRTVLFRRLRRGDDGPAVVGRWTGLDGEVIGIDRFGASAPGATVFREYGFTVDHVVAQALAPTGRRTERESP